MTSAHPGRHRPSPRHRSRPGREIGAVLVAVVLVIGGCGGGHQSAVIGRPGADLVTALCDAASKAGAGEPAAARKVFFDRAHQPIHELASANFAGPGRAAASHLLETTQRVEADLGDRGVTDRLAEDLTAVADAVRALPGATGQPSPPSCRGGSR